MSEQIGLNFTPLLQSIDNDLQLWMNLPQSISGRIASIKMAILPKIEYLVSMFPTHPTLSWFNSRDLIIAKFYWKNKITILSGLDAHHLCYGQQLHFIYKCTYPNHSDPTWLGIEPTFCKDLHILCLSQSMFQEYQV